MNIRELRQGNTKKAGPVYAEASSSQSIDDDELMGAFSDEESEEVQEKIGVLDVKQVHPVNESQVDINMKTQITKTKE